MPQNPSALIKPISNAVSSFDWLKTMNLTLSGKQLTAGAAAVLLIATAINGHYATKDTKIREVEETKRNRDNQNAETERRRIDAKRDIALARIQAKNSSPLPAE